MTTRWWRIAAWLLATAAVAIALQLLARHQLRNQLVREAVATLAPLAHAQSPYRWQLGAAQELIGRRVFGACAFAFETDMLRLRAGSRVCEIGLVLRTPLDLRRFDRLTVTGPGKRPAFQLQVRERLDAPLYLAAVPASDSATEIVLSALRWDGEHGTSGNPTTPQRAAMLRLRFADLANDVQLRALSVSPGSTLHWPPPHAVATATWHRFDTATAADPQQPPLYVVDDASRPETVLYARDRLREREPAAVVVVRDDIPQVAAGVAAVPGPRPASTPQAYVILAALLVVMILGLQRPTDVRRRALLQAMTALALPLWLVMGLRIGDDLDSGTQALIVLAVVYLAALAWSDTARQWDWLGTRRAWLWAATAPLASLVVVLALGEVTPSAITPGAVARYALWALMQQYLIAVVFADRLRAAGLSAGATVLAAATVFALLHTPNAALMTATFAGGLVWSAAWQGERSLLPLAVSHAVAALLLTSGLPVAWFRSAEVSLRYYL